jgi:hypothetical protein
MFRYRCTGCRRVLRRRECVRSDDPMAPFGPEIVCPECESLVTLHAGPIATGLVAMTALLLGFGAGCLLSRLFEVLAG